MPELDPTDHTIDELDDELESIEDPEELRTIREAEANGENRTGAIEVLEERLAAVVDELERREERLEDISDELEDRGETANNSDDGSNGTDSNDGIGTDAATNEDVDLVVVRNKVRNTAADLIGRDLDGIIGVRANDEGWEATVEVVERHSVPDVQDILGRYLLTLDESARIVEYSRLGRYRRGDTAPFEET